MSAYWEVPGREMMLAVCQDDAQDREWPLRAN